MIEVTPLADGIRFQVRVQPRSSRNEIVGEQQGALKVKLTAPPLEGEANRALIAFLAEVLGVAKKDISLLKGQSSRTKLVEVRGVTAAEFIARVDR